MERTFLAKCFLKNTLRVESQLRSWKKTIAAGFKRKISKKPKLFFLPFLVHQLSNAITQTHDKLCSNSRKVENWQLIN